MYICSQYHNPTTNLYSPFILFQNFVALINVECRMHVNLSWPKSGYLITHLYLSIK